MGFAGLKELLQRADRFDVTLLARSSAKNRRLLGPYLRKHPGINVIWGDLLRYEDVLRGVEKADYVLHVGGMVSPMADHFPELTLKVNVTAAHHIAKAVQQVESGQSGVPRQIKVVYIGSVAQYGDRMPPRHWGSADDPLCPVPTDAYARSKVMAEEIISHSGLSHWISLRQSGILAPCLLRKASDPITFHVPLNGVLEWATVEDSGRLLAQLCEDFVPESFWNKCYNIGSGAAYRLTNYEFEKYLLHAIYCPAPERIFRPQWFAAGHFHGMWYTDSDALEQVLHFRENLSITDYFDRFRRQLPWYFPLARLVPAGIIRALMAGIAKKARKDLGSNFGTPLTCWSEVVRPE